jgi:hypothetical protein
MGRAAHSASQFGENELIDNDLRIPEEVKGLACGLAHLKVTHSEHPLPILDQ